MNNTTKITERQYGAVWMTMEEAGLRFNAMTGDKSTWDKITLADISDLIWAPTFEEFLWQNTVMGRIYITDQKVLNAF